MMATALVTSMMMLAPGARVEVLSIRGPVEIVSTDSAMAEVQIIRTARSRADLEYYKIEVAQTASGLIVRGIQEPEERRRQNVQVNHHVRLKLPRRIDLAITSVSGYLRAGDVDGQTKVTSISGSATFGNVGGTLQASSISGNLEVGNVGAETRVTSISGNLSLWQVNGPLEVSSVSGSLSATIDNLGTQGVHIKSVSGSIELKLKVQVNADFTAEDVSGQVYLDITNVTREAEARSSNVRARIGAGGSPISISCVSGNIRLTRS